MIGPDCGLSPQAQAFDFIVVGTPLYKEKYDNRLSEAGSVVAAEADLIRARLLGTEGEKNTVLPLLREGDLKNALPPLMRGRVRGDFRGGVVLEK